MRIRNIFMLKRPLAGCNEKGSSGMDLWVKMRSGIVILFFLSGFFIQTGCSRHFSGFSVKPGVNGSYDTATYDFLFVEAIKQKLLGNSGDAIKMLEQCIIMNPGSDAPYYQVAQILLSSGDISKGKKFAIKAYSADQRNIWYLSLLAGIYYQEKNLDSAVMFYEKIVKFYPERDGIRLTLGNIYAEKGDTKKADENYSFLESKYGISEEVTVSQIKNLVNAKKFSEAEQKINLLIMDSPENMLYHGILAEIYRSAGENEKALEVYRKLMILDANDPQTLMSLSDFLLETQNFNELFSIMNSLILNERIQKEDKISLIARCLDNDTLIVSRGDDYEIVLRVFEAMYPGDNMVNMIRPEYYHKAGKTDLAVKRCEEIIAETPENYFGWEKLLLLYSEKGDYENLLIKGQECATKFNRSYLAKILYASAALEKGKYDIALEEIRKAKILAGDQNELLVQALTMEADAYYRKKEYSKSFETFKEALKINPSDLTVLNNYAYFLAEQGQELNEAEEMSRLVIEKEGENKTFLDTYAWVLYKRGKIKEAAKIMEKIMSGGEDDADWFEHYGYIMKAEKKCEIAVQYWKRSVSLDNKRQHLLKEIENCSERD
jgi:tetratricopeptide (TPR) repeat protein